MHSAETAKPFVQPRASPIGPIAHVRRVDRFRRVMASDETKLLFMLAGWQTATEEDFIALCAQIDARSDKALLLLVNVAPREDGDATQAGAHLVRAIGPHRMIQFESTSPAVADLASPM